MTVYGQTKRTNKEKGGGEETRIKKNRACGSLVLKTVA
jgi:hypothetical protein